MEVVFVRDAVKQMTGLEMENRKQKRSFSLSLSFFLCLSLTHGWVCGADVQVYQVLNMCVCVFC